MNRLLVIDDEEDVLYAFTRHFGPPEFELLTAASGEEGLRRVPEFKPDLVHCDMRMDAGMSGLETLRRIREIAPKVILEEVNRKGETIIVVTHNMVIAKRAKRLLRIQDGAVTEEHV